MKAASALEGLNGKTVKTCSTRFAAQRETGVQNIHIFTERVKEGRNWVLRSFQQLRSYRDEIETRNREEIPYSSRIVPRGLSVAEGP